jgi:hypothetical protein
MSIATLFKTLIDRIQPTENETKAVDSHLSSIKTRLNLAPLERKYFIAGSQSRDSSIYGRSDVDLFVMLKRDEVRWGDQYRTSTTVLANIKKELDGRFPNTSIYTDVNAIAIDFSDCHADVVPVFYADKTEDGWPLYYMPDGSGGWMKTSPGKHNKCINDADAASGGMLKRTAQLMKFWRECRSPRIPLSSFHIEMVLASEKICVGVKSYADCIKELLQSLAKRECRGIQDPLGISGIIPCVKTENQRATALASVRYSRDQAKSAVDYESLWPLQAKKHWDTVFNGKFPK